MECIEFNNVTKSYGNDGVIKDVSFSVPCVEKYALIEPRSADKSRIKKLAAGLLEPDSGKVSIKGLPLNSIENPKNVDKLTDFYDLRKYENTLTDNISRENELKLATALAIAYYLNLLSLDECWHKVMYESKLTSGDELIKKEGGE